MTAAIAMPNGKMRIPDRAFSPTEVESNGSGAPRLALLHRLAGDPHFLEAHPRSRAALNPPKMYRFPPAARAGRWSSTGTAACGAYVPNHFSGVSSRTDSF